ncbi:MAG: hypothetical protein MUO27_04360 [Sedimentisphaerales bacterium]|nr:hypothetical protein [Sedimentisphaerales bacterium]
MKTLRVAFSDRPLGPWGSSSAPFTGGFCEAPTILKLGNEWIVYFEMTDKGQYGAAKTQDFNTWMDLTSLVSFPQGHHHGTVLKVSSAVLEKLKQL